MTAFVAAFWALSLSAPGYAQDTEKTPVMLDVINGDTQFLVDPDSVKTWWLVGDCRREIPMGSNATVSASGVMTSQKTSDEVTLGQRQVVLEQQFRFNLTATPVSVEVFNSVRGGWASVPVSENTTCSLQASCRARMELPNC